MATSLAQPSPASAQDGPIAIGSDAHKRLFCSLMLDTHDPYDPERIEWPALDADCLARLQALPFWNDAVTTEDGATRDLNALAAAETDPLVRQAVELQAFEEARHARVIAGMCRAYGIEAHIEPGYKPPIDPEWAELRMGYGECFDSFFAFGLFALAGDSGFFPPELVRVFEPVIQEEARHIVFFVNWMAWTRANRPWWRRPSFRLRCARALGLQAWKRLKTARGAASKDNFTSKGAASFDVDLDPKAFFALCLSENERRMARFDARLRRPRAMPSAIGLVVRLLPGSRKAKPA
jgi:hypothetical protein